MTECLTNIGVKTATQRREKVYDRENITEAHARIIHKEKEKRGFKKKLNITRGRIRKKKGGKKSKCNLFPI